MRAVSFPRTFGASHPLDAAFLTGFVMMAFAMDHWFWFALAFGVLIGLCWIYSDVTTLGVGEDHDY